MLFMLILSAVGSQCAGAEAEARAYVGFLPFTAVDTVKWAPEQAIPGLISWELHFIPRIDQAEMRRLVVCMQIDKLTRPREMTDAAGYAALADALGVEYLATGRIISCDRKRTRFVIHVYRTRSQKTHFRREYECSTDAIPQTAYDAAGDISRALHVPFVGSPMKQRPRIGWKALRSLERALRWASQEDAGTLEFRNASAEAQDAASACLDCPYAHVLAVSYGYSAGLAFSGLEEVLGEWPGSALLFRRLIEARANAGDFINAHAYAQRWIERDPTSPCARILEAAVRGKAAVQNEWEVPEEQAGGGSQAVSGPGSLLPPEFFENVLAAGITAWRVYADVAECSSAADDPELARKWTAHLQKLRPSSAYVNVVIAQIYERLGMYAEAIDNYGSACRINPDSYQAQMGLARAYLAADQAAQALKVVKEAMDRWPDRTDGHWLAARIYRKIGRTEEAVAELETLKRLDPDDRVSREYLAAEYIRAGRILEGVREFSKTMPGARRAILTVAVILTGIFLIILVWIAFLVRAVLAPDRTPRIRQADDSGTKPGESGGRD